MHLTHTDLDFPFQFFILSKLNTTQEEELLEEMVSLVECIGSNLYW